MSKWGLAYKGGEILTPEERNKVVDALEELDSRTPTEIKGGIVAFEGDGATTTFQIAHGLSTTPTTCFVGKGASGLPDIDYWEANPTYITVHFKSAPASGVSVTLWWLAILL
ncbi:MAG: hypothetical protein DRP74_09205 [Candidatus Omnitrophota bacterium]|nr:MAG: hypothetical protein DRP74_09205 [Candidatus Omnitrophota bacterium]